MKSNPGLAIGLGIGIPVFVVLIIIICACVIKRKKDTDGTDGKKETHGDGKGPQDKKVVERVGGAK